VVHRETVEQQPDADGEGAQAADDQRCLALRRYPSGTAWPQSMAVPKAAAKSQ
jgi:hypothetical protein